jgi:isoleucyl-tRNA synthetase
MHRRFRWPAPGPPGLGRPRATARARELGLPAVALSFEPLPREFFAKDAKPSRCAATCPSASRAGSSRLGRKGSTSACASSAGPPLFVLHDGPPYANGHPHRPRGQQDPQGHDRQGEASWPASTRPTCPGWDCHGLPIENAIEKLHGRNLSRDEVQAKSRAYATSRSTSSEGDFKRLGVLGDWDNPYRTMDFANEAGEIRALKRVIERLRLPRPEAGVLVLRLRLGAGRGRDRIRRTSSEAAKAWKSRCRSGPPRRGRCRRRWRSRWARSSTTCWSKARTPRMAAPLAGAGRALAEKALKRYGVDEVVVLGRAVGEKLEGLLFAHPFYASATFRSCSATTCRAEDGTGAVHTAPGHGQEDFAVSQALRPGRCRATTLPAQSGRWPWRVPAVDAAGDGTELPACTCGRPTTPSSRCCARAASPAGVLEAEHSYPHCWRHKTPVAFRATPQWFISMDQARPARDALAAIKTVTWYPEWGEARIAGMIDGPPGLDDLAPAHLGRADRAVRAPRNRRTASAQRRADAPGRGSRGAGRRGCLVRSMPPTCSATRRALRQGHRHPRCLVRFRHHPRSVLLSAASASPRTCTWKAPTSIAAGSRVAADRRRHRQGRAVSAVPDPRLHRGRARPQDVEVAGQRHRAAGHHEDAGRGHPAPVDRVADYSNEMSLSQEILKRNADAYRRIRNTARFLLGNLHGFDPARDLRPLEDMVALDRWIVHRAWQVQERSSAPTRATTSPRSCRR